MGKLSSHVEREDKSEKRAQRYEEIKLITNISSNYITDRMNISLANDIQSWNWRIARIIIMSRVACHKIALKIWNVNSIAKWWPYDRWRKNLVAAQNHSILRLVQHSFMKCYTILRKFLSLPQKPKLEQEPQNPKTAVISNFVVIGSVVMGSVLSEWIKLVWYKIYYCYFVQKLLSLILHNVEQMWMVEALNYVLIKQSCRKKLYASVPILIPIISVAQKNLMPWCALDNSDTTVLNSYHQVKHTYLSESVESN